MRRFFRAFLYLLSIHVIALLILTVFRFILLCTIHSAITPAYQGNWQIQSVAFLRGIWFDNVIACYILLLPLIALMITSLVGYYGRLFFRGVNIFLIIFYAIDFGVSAANIPYFDYFFKNINSSIFNWFSYGTTTMGMVIGERSYYIYIFYFLLAVATLVYAMRRLSRYFCYRIQQTPKRDYNVWVRRSGLMVASCCLISLCVFGMRGRRGYNPIKVSAAYYCDDPSLNQLGISPAFNLLGSTLDEMKAENRYLNLIPDAEAINNVRQYLDRHSEGSISPIAQRIVATGCPTKQNLVIVFMESMSAHLMGHFGHSPSLTPFLDSLYGRSLCFNNFYSAGNHTNHGLYSTLYSFPSIMKRNSMKGSVIPIYSGLPTVLKANGYLNMFFMTHESQYDNMNAFFRTNGFDRIYSQEDYPKDKVVNSFGVQDDYLFSYAIPVLNKAASTGRPFFAALMTISNHPPYIVPASFQAHSHNTEDQIVEYADWAIRCFMQEASKQPWFDNTIFVFLGDHGKIVGKADCETPLSYNHIPLIVYGQSIKPEVRRDYAGQIDVAPTLLDLLNISYTQNNFGIDLMRQKRPAVFFTTDNSIAVRDALHLYVYNPCTRQEFCYNMNGCHCSQAKMNVQFMALKKYCFSMIQATEVLTHSHKTIDKSKNSKYYY